MRAILVSLSGLALVLAVGCGGGSNADDTATPQCSDGKDNDGDGTIDFPDDLGCTSAEGDNEAAPTSAKCEDGRDNDGDGKTDYPADPGCFAAQADSEVDDCPSGPNCPQCADGQDNDDNGSMDYPNDPGCESAADDEEFPMNSVACGATLMIQSLPATNSVSAMLDATSTSMVVSPCGGGGGASARAYVLHLDAPKVVEISTDDAATTADTIIDLRSMDCMEQTAEIACSDDIDANNTNSKLTAPLQAGSYYIIVSGVDAATSGAFHLDVRLYNGEGTACSGASDCGPGLVCRTPLDGTSDVCSKPVCDDGMDDDADGKADYPSDPGCSTPEDTDETDDCPDGPNCPECSDGDDNDDDTKIDYPNDPTCQAAGDASESCPSTDGVTLITAATTSGTTSGAQDDVTPSTSCSYSSSAPDLTYRLDVPSLTSLNITLSPDYDAVLSVFDSTCSGTTLACDDTIGVDEAVALSDVQAGSYYVVVDGYNTYAGTFSFAVSGKITNGGSCEGALAQAGAFTCGAGFACKGAAGSRTCQPSLCGDGVDNDADGKIDFPFDPGCESIADDTEANPMTLPVCSNTVDDDMDSSTDFPNDYGCASAAGTSEEFCTAESDPTALIATAATTSTLVDKTNDQVASCGFPDATAADVTFALSLPVPVDRLVIDTIDPAMPTDELDSVVYVMDPQCTAELACDDDADGHFAGASEVIMTGVAAGNYAIVVDGYSDTTVPMPFVLNVHGTVAAQTVCASPMFAAGILACPTGTTCKNVSGIKRCST